MGCYNSNDNAEKELKNEVNIPPKPTKLLLLGLNGSGKSTLLKSLQHVHSKYKGYKHRIDSNIIKVKLRKHMINEILKCTDVCFSKCKFYFQ